jgi:hypothetical protein
VTGKIPKGRTKRLKARAGDLENRLIGFACILLVAGAKRKKNFSALASEKPNRQKSVKFVEINVDAKFEIKAGGHRF